MALTTTTLSSAVSVSDGSIVVASATGFAAGSFVLIDQELLKVVQTYVSGTTIGVLRGQNGTVTAAHVASANVTVGLASDFANPVAETDTTYPTARGRTVTSYSASGAIALPAGGSDAMAILNGTSTLAMTLAAPTKDMDGTLLYIVGNGKSASHVDVAAGYGNAGSGYTVLTAQNAGLVGFTLCACNGFWVIVGAPPITGTSTKVSIAIS